jgi:hypothetical protein
MSGDVVHNLRVSRSERRIGRVGVGSDSSVRNMPQADEATSIKERAVSSCDSHVPGVGLHLVTMNVSMPRYLQPPGSLLRFSMGLVYWMADVKTDFDRELKMQTFAIGRNLPKSADRAPSRNQIVDCKTRNNRFRKSDIDPCFLLRTSSQERTSRCKGAQPPLSEIYC